MSSRGMPRGREVLTKDQIDELLNEYDSEIDEDFYNDDVSSENDILIEHVLPDKQNGFTHIEREQIESEECIENILDGDIPEEESATNQIFIEENIEVEYIDNFYNFDVTDKKDIEWKEQIPRRTPFEFTNVEEAEEVVDDLSPLICFLKYIPVEFFEKAAFHTNLYAVQNGHKWKPTTGIEIIKLFGLHVYIGTLGNYF
jgi:hypothetical protein